MKQRVLLTLLLLSTLSFGQMPESKAQKRDCSKASKALKKNGTDPNLSLENFNALLAALRLACSSPEDYAATHRSSGLPSAQEETAYNKTANWGDISKQLDKAVDDGHSTTQDSQPSQDIHERVAQSSTSLNREIALGNRLIAHFQKAQTWEGIDAEHPEAVALRDKISHEETELREAASASSKIMDSIDLHLAQKTCSPEEVDHWVSLVTEATGVLGDVKTQQDRYHALGY